MRYKKLGSGYFVRLETGESLIENLIAFCRKQRVRAGFFNGLGAVSEAELGHFESKTKKYISRRFSGQYEITALHGNISTHEGKPFIHAHVVIAGRKFEALAGHLQEAVVCPTCEIVLIPLKGNVLRKLDPRTGLNLLDL